MIQYGKHIIEEDDIDSVISVLKSQFLTQGPVVGSFEAAVATYCGAKFAISSNSATSSLHLAMLALDISSKDLIWTSAITFVATSNAALYCGAKVDFLDIDKETFNLDVKALARKLEIAEASSSLPTLLVVVHLGGAPVDMEKIDRLSERYGFEVIEDASHAIGGSYESEKIGSCKWSKMCIFSFHPVKIITAGEGGVITTNDFELSAKVRTLRTHGIEPNQSADDKNEELWNYYQTGLGFNYRMTEIHAALGLSQVSKIDRFVKVRNEIANYYKEEFESLPVSVQSVPSGSYSSYHLFILRFDVVSLKKTKKAIYYEYQEQGINVNFHYIPVYRHPYYESLGFKKGYCQESERYFLDALSIPLHPGLSSSDVEFVAENTKKIVG